MKKLFAAILFVSLSVGAFAQGNKGVEFEQATLKELLAKSGTENKPVFIDIYAVWCPPCKYMSESVFPRSDMGEFFNANFINAKFDAERGEGIEVARKYSVMAYPTFLILDSTGKELGRVVGAKDSADFIQTVKNIIGKSDMIVSRKAR